MVESITERTVKAFNNLSLPKEKWTHEAHLRVGLWYLLHYSPAEAMCRLRAGICQYNIACGVANTETSGYHETITKFYVTIISYFLQRQNANLPIEELAAKLLESYGDRNLLLSYYSQARLMSPEARYRWVEPNLLPMPEI